MAWHWSSTCSACAFVSRQLGTHTPCLSHAGAWSSADAEPDSAPQLADATERHCQMTRPRVGRGHDERTVVSTPRPTADRLGPFTLREYACLLLLRSRVADLEA